MKRFSVTVGDDPSPLVVAFEIILVVTVGFIVLASIVTAIAKAIVEFPH